MAHGKIEQRGQINTSEPHNQIYMVRQYLLYTKSQVS